MTKGKTFFPLSQNTRKPFFLSSLLIIIMSTEEDMAAFVLPAYHLIVLSVRLCIDNIIQSQSWLLVRS